MSSPSKDAQWGLTLCWLESIGLNSSDLDYFAFQKVLAVAERKLSKNPSEIPFWADRFNADQN